MVSEGRLCCWPPVECRRPRLCVAPPLVVYPVALLNGGSGVCCAAPCSDWVWHLVLSVPLHIVLVPLVSFLFLFCLVLSCLLWVGKCGGACCLHTRIVVRVSVCCVMAVCAVSCLALLLFRFCVCCHSIVGLVLCLCDRVVSLWNRCDGLVGRKGEWCLLSTLHVLWCVFQCVVCVVLLCCVVGCGMAGCEGVWSRSFVFLVVLSSSSFCLPLLLLVVSVRGSARAALRARTLSPNTIVLPRCFVLFRLVSSCLSLPAFLRTPPFLLLWNGGGVTMYHCVVLA